MSVDKLSAEEILQVGEPLLRIDPILDRFVEHVGATITRVYVENPSRYIRLKTGADEINRAIQIQPVISNPQKGWSKGNFSFHFALLAWKDLHRQRYRWGCIHAALEEIPTDEETLFKLLNDCLARLNSVKEENVTPATKLQI